MAIILYKLVVDTGVEETAVTLRLLQPVLNTLVTIPEYIILVPYVPYCKLDNVFQIQNIKI